MFVRSDLKTVASCIKLSVLKQLISSRVINLTSTSVLFIFEGWRTGFGATGVTSRLLDVLPRRDPFLPISTSFGDVVEGAILLSKFGEESGLIQVRRPASDLLCSREEGSEGRDILR